MINYFMKKYAMSQTGANNLRKAVFSRTILNLTKMFPPMIAFYVYISIAKRYGYCGRGDSINTTKLCTYYIGNAFCYVFCCKMGLYPSIYERLQ